MNPLDKQVAGNHYSAKIQHVEFVTANDIPYMEAQVMRYICRHDKKNGMEDIEKAMHYCQLIAKLRYGVDVEVNTIEPINRVEARIIEEMNNDSK